MTFELALIIIAALAAVILGLVCYHLLGRLEMLERSVQGGLQPPSTRLSREQFERRFRTAHARSALAREIGTGVLLVTGAEYTAESELAATMDHLARADLITQRDVTAIDATTLGVATTPYLFIIDENRIRTAQPLAGTTDLINALERFT